MFLNQTNQSNVSQLAGGGRTDRVVERFRQARDDAQGLLKHDWVVALESSVNKWHDLWKSFKNGCKF